MNEYRFITMWILNFILTVLVGVILLMLYATHPFLFWFVLTCLFISLIVTAVMNEPDPLNWEED